MSLDLDSRLRDYGTDIDTAIDTPAAGSVASAPVRSRWVRFGVPAAAAALVAVATGVLIAGRGPDTSRPASGVTESTVDLSPEHDYHLDFGPGDWEYAEPDAPVRLADDLVPWYVLADEAAAPFDDTGVLPAEGYWLLACTEWLEADDGSILCSGLESSDLEPAAAYRDGEGREVAITTARIGANSANNYAIELWYVRNGNTAPAVESLDLDGQDAWFSEGTDGRLAVVWSPSPGLAVAVETRGLSVDETTELARAIVPVPHEEVPAVPLVLARSNQPDSFLAWVRDDRVLGAVADGTVCAFSSDYILGDGFSSCLALRTDSMLLTAHGQGGLAGRFAGLVSAEVALIRLDFDDGTQLTVRPTPQPVGDVQAFATKVSGPPATTVTALDADGNELMTIDVASLNEQLMPNVPITERAEPTGG